MEVINSNLEEEKQTTLIGDPPRKTWRGLLNYPKYFPASTKVNAGIAGDIVEAIL